MNEIDKCHDFRYAHRTAPHNTTQQKKNKNITMKMKKKKSIFIDTYYIVKTMRTWLKWIECSLLLAFAIRHSPVAVCLFVSIFCIIITYVHTIGSLKMVWNSTCSGVHVCVCLHLCWNWTICSVSIALWELRNSFLLLSVVHKISEKFMFCKSKE